MSYLLSNYDNMKPVFDNIFAKYKLEVDNFAKKTSDFDSVITLQEYIEKGKTVNNNSYRYYDRNTIQLAEFPGCCSTIMWYRFQYQIDDRLVKNCNIIKNIMNDFGYNSLLLITTDPHVIDLLKNEGFILLSTFINTIHSDNKNYLMQYIRTTEGEHANLQWR